MGLMEKFESEIKGFAAGLICIVISTNFFSFMGEWAMPCGLFIGACAFVLVRYLSQQVDS
jgi:hypothetical protein